MLHMAAKFINYHQDLIYLYKTFINRSVMEFSAVVWHSSLSQANFSIERNQKSAMTVILKDQYKNYKSALIQLKLESLSKRREILFLKFAKK